MENLFSPGKWLVLFCGVFVLLWGVLQFVSNARLKQEAEIVGKSVFTWSWPGDWRSEAQVTDAAVVQKTDKDAVVKIKGKQTLSKLASGAGAGPVLETVDCAATLTFYRMSVKDKDYWMLGKVEFP